MVGVRPLPLPANPVARQPAWLVDVEHQDDNEHDESEGGGVDEVAAQFLKPRGVGAASRSGQLAHVWHVQHEYRGGDRGHRQGETTQ